MGTGDDSGADADTSASTGVGTGEPDPEREPDPGPGDVGRPRANRTRLVVGGTGVVVAILGFTVAQAAIDATGLRPETVLLVLPVFGVLGLASFAALLSAVLVPEPRES
jgi:hypothetical protein